MAVNGTHNAYRAVSLVESLNSIGRDLEELHRLEERAQVLADRIELHRLRLIVLGARISRAQ